jgi:sulfatase maturation enzyme AslB (radical SAM superfamily)
MMQLRIWQTATLVMILLWLATLLWKRRDTAIAKQQDKAAIQANTRQTISVNELAKTVQSGNLKMTYQQLLNFASQYHADIRSIRDIMAYVGDQSLCQVVANIDSCRYGAVNKEWTISKEQLKLLEQQLQNSRKAKQDEQAGLQPLHPKHD